MTQAFTLVSARFPAPLSAGDDRSGHPEGARISAAGSEVDWQDTGQPARRRDIRTWIAVWPDAASAAAWLDTRQARIPLLAGALESWAGMMLPYATHGTVNWAADGQMASVFSELGPRPDKGRPVFVMTTLGVGAPGPGLAAFGQGTRAVRAAFRQRPGVILEQQLLPDLPLADAPTLSLWATEAEVIAAAYRSEPHRSAMKVADLPELARGSFTRMVLARAEGVWNGVDLARLV